MNALRDNPRRLSLTIDITYNCNLNCLNCDRYCNQARTDECMAIEQIEKFVKETCGYNIPWEVIKISGGEPTVHPRLLDILEIIRSLELNTIIFTNGMVENDFPDWVSIHNSKKVGRYIPAHTDMTQCPEDENVAPRPFGECQMNVNCGICLNRYGYYFSSPCAGIDRVFGFDLGVKRIADVLESDYSILEKRAMLLCRYCGHGRISEKHSTKEEVHSKTWARVLSEYNQKRPYMTLY